MFTRFLTFLFFVIIYGIGNIYSTAALIPESDDQFKGKTAPLFSIKSLKGEKISLKDYRGKTVLLNFFASWCPPCRLEMEDLKRLHQQYNGKGLVIIGVAVDPLTTPETVGDVKPLVERLTIPYPVILATAQIGKDYPFEGVPTSFVIGEDGKIKKFLYGYQDGKEMEETLKKLLPATETKTP